MRHLLFILVLLPTLASAQDQFFWLNSRTGLPLFQNPTNIPGSPVTVEWDSHDYYTNSGVPWTTNRLAGNYTLTNRAASLLWPKRGTTNLNGFNTVYLGGVGTFMNCVNYTSAQPHEVVAVINWESGSGPVNAAYFMDSLDAAARNAAYESPGTHLQVANAGTELAGDSTLAQLQWIVLDIQFNGGSTKIYTNNVLMKSGAAGSQAMNGLILGADNTFSQSAVFQWAKIYLYQSLLSTANQVSNYNYLTNYYKLTP